MPATKPQDQIIETIETLQNRVIETNAKLVAEINNLVPDQVSERIASIPRPDLPAPSEAVEVCFDFVERVTESSRRFADEMVKVWNPEAEEATAPAEKATTAKAAPAKKAPAAKAKATKATARKTTAKKAPAKKAAAKKTTTK